MQVYSLFKRIADSVAALLILSISAPIWIPVSILLYFANGRALFFVQKRIGKGNKEFKVYKFKTMNDKVNKNGELLPDNERITRLGKWVRSSSIDELPQLINVLKGDMSLVGPRPLLVQYLPLYNERQIRRHEVTPGITGWAQVNGRNSISWESKFEHDVYYVDHRGFLMDIRILLLTFVKVVKRDGIDVDASTTMAPFRGTKEN